MGPTAGTNKMKKKWSRRRAVQRKIRTYTTGGAGSSGSLSLSLSILPIWKLRSILLACLCHAYHMHPEGYVWFGIFSSFSFLIKNHKRAHADVPMSCTIIIWILWFYCFEIGAMHFRRSLWGRRTFKTEQNPLRELDANLFLHHDRYISHRKRRPLTVSEKC